MRPDDGDAAHGQRESDRTVMVPGLDLGLGVKIAIALLVILTPLSPSLAALDHDSAGSCLPLGPAVARVAAREHPHVAWDTSAVFVADVNCDGIEDYALGGVVDSTFYAGVVLGPLCVSARVSVLEFRLAPWAEDGLGGWPAQLSLDRLAEPPPEAGIVEGLEPSDRCRGLCIVAGDIDPFILYWNHKRSQLDWWRL